MAKAPCITYACVCSPDQKVLSEGGDKSTIESTLDAFIGGVATNAKEKAAFSHGPYTYTFLKNRGHVFIAVAPVALHAKVVFRFLHDLISEFNTGGDKRNVTAKLNNLLVHYSKPENQDLVTTIQTDLDVTIETMKENVEAVRLQGASLEELEQNAMSAESNSHMLVENSQGVVNVVWWRRMKFRICVGVCCALVILIIVAVIVLVVVLK